MDREREGAEDQKVSCGERGWRRSDLSHPTSLSLSLLSSPLVVVGEKGRQIEHVWMEEVRWSLGMSSDGVSLEEGERDNSSACL